jgi:hypothetical protein
MDTKSYDEESYGPWVIPGGYILEILSLLNCFDCPGNHAAETVMRVCQYRGTQDTKI